MKHFLALVFFGLLSYTSHAQDPCVTIGGLPDTIRLCKNQAYSLNATATLSGAARILYTVWSPGFAFTDDSALITSLGVLSNSQNYILTVTGLSGTNLVTNGDFDAGNTGFTSQYAYNTGGANGPITNSGTYTVTNNPSVANTTFVQFPDHTGNAAAQMFIANGITAPAINAWCQNVAVTQNTDYEYSIWAASANSIAPAEIQLSINGANISSITSPSILSNVLGAWKKIDVVWNSGTSTSADLCVSNNNIVTNGNDFALDDIELRELCYGKDTVYAQITNLQPNITPDIYFGCTEDSVKFNVIDLGATPNTYSWDFGDGTPISTLREPSHIYPVQNNYTVRLTTTIEANAITGAPACTDVTTTFVNTLHPLVASFSISDDTICLGERIQFTSTSNIIINPATHFFDLGDGSTFNTSTVDYLYEAEGTYIIRYLVADGVPCRDSTTDTVVVIGSFDPKIVISDTLACEGESIFFSTDDSRITTNRRYIISNGQSYLNTPTFNSSFDTSGTYTLTLIEKYIQCPTDTITATFTVNPFPRVNLGRDTVLCPEGKAILLENLVNDPNFANATPVWSTGRTTASIQARDIGTYWLTETSEFGCATTDSIKIEKGCYIDIPNAFIAGNAGGGGYFLPRQLLSGQVTKFNMQVYNRWGQKVFESESLEGRGWDGNFNGKEQPVGVYVYRIQVQIADRIAESYTGNVTLLR